MPPYFRKLALNHTYFLTHISKPDAVTEKKYLNSTILIGLQESILHCLEHCHKEKVQE